MLWIVSTRNVRDSDTVQYTRGREFICSSSIFCKRRKGKEIPRKVYVNCELDDLLHLLHIMNSVYDVFFL